MPAIKIEGLSKKYIIGHQKQERYTALRDVIMHKMRGLGQRLRHPLSPNREEIDVEEFWALRDINLEIKQGDRVGIIGRNGAGKSTLLKVLSRITEPTSGKIHIKGRIASLLEVGTGFHPELSGRENIYLNGAILGMSKAEIKRKFDEIVDFSGVEKFLDTPVKRYSSGMYVRLAFAVAAHLEPEILIVDEVLAVGDAQFQKKCLGKMADAGKEGRTVLFVSHNMNAIEMFCNSVAILDKGCLSQHSQNVSEGIKQYLSHDDNSVSMAKWVNIEGQFENPYFKPTRLLLTDKDGDLLSMPVRNDDDIWIQVEGEVSILDDALTIGVAVYANEELLFWSYQTDSAQDMWVDIVEGVNVFRCKMPKRLLNEGVYRVDLLGGLHCRQWLFEPRGRVPSISLEIQGGLSESQYWIIKRPGLIAPELLWEKG